MTQNVLQNVQTWQKSMLAAQANFGPWISWANTKFKDFQNFEGQLGATVRYQTPPRTVADEGLDVNWQPLIQPERALTVDEAYNVPLQFTAEQLVFNNIDDYMNTQGRALVEALGTRLEQSVARRAITNPYRFFNFSQTSLSSTLQLAKMIETFKNMGYANQRDIKVILDHTDIPEIINSQQNQFTLDRNNENAQSWELMSWRGVKFGTTNILEEHLAGSVGNNDDTLTVVSTDDPSGNYITRITFSGASAVSDPDAIKKHDSLYFLGDVVNFTSFYGGIRSRNTLQVRVLEDEGSTAGGEVTVEVYPPLVATAGSAQRNITTNIVAGMTAKVLPNHRAGLLWGNDAMFCAMPKLPEKSPFYTGRSVDPDKGISTRFSYGAVFDKNQYGYIYDAIIGSDINPDDCMKIVFPY